MRRLRNCPPFFDQIQIGFSGFPERHVEDRARWFAQTLWHRLEASGLLPGVADLLGPAPYAVAKVNNQFRFRLTLACINSKPLCQLLSELVRGFPKEKMNRGVRVFVDINGYE